MIDVERLHSKCDPKTCGVRSIMAERDALREAVAENVATMEAYVVERDALQQAWNAEPEVERLRAELECHAASEQGSVVANRKPGSPKDPQAETPVEAVRRFQRDYPLDTSDPYTKLFAIAELRTAKLTELREAALDLACEHMGMDSNEELLLWLETLPASHPGHDTPWGRFFTVLAKAAPIA